MSNNKESSVEWYIIERHNIEIQSRLGEISPIEYDAKLIKIEEQAKAMHKSEHAATARDWWIEGTSDARKASTGKYESFDDYYSKKFTSEQPTQD